MRAVVAFLALLALGAPASAATFAEQPFTATPGIATCVRPTGAPGGLTQIGPLRRNSTATDLLRATGEGTVLTGRVRLGLLTDCPSGAEAGGAAVVAGPVWRGESSIELRAAVRDAGGGFGAPVPLARGGRSMETQSVAIAPSGAAVVAWLQATTDDRERVVAFRRSPGGGFGPAEALTPWRRGGAFENERTVSAVTPDGRVTVAWTRSASRRGSGVSAVETVTTALGERFGAPQRLARATGVDGPALATARDGWALLAFTDDGGARVFERPPGASAFRPAARFDRVPTGEGQPTVAVREGGGGVVAWRSTFEAGVAATVRPAAGPFAKPRTVTPRGGTATGGFGVATAIVVSTPGDRGPFAPIDQDGGRLRVALGDSGDAVLSWIDARPVGGDRVDAPRAATGTLDGGLGVAERLGGTVRIANGVAPLRLEDGRGAVVWTDNLSDSRLLDLPRGGGRRHVAIAGAPAPAAVVPPQIRVTVPGGQRLHQDEALRATVRCAAACDLRAFARRGRATVVARGDALLRKAGRARLRLHPGSFGDLLPWTSGRVTVVVRASAPGATTAVSTGGPVRVIPRPIPPFAPPHGVLARRRGGRIVVTWHTAVPARRISYEVWGRARRGRSVSGRDVFRSVSGKGRRSFRVTLKPRRPRDVRWVDVIAQARDRPYRSRVVLVPVSA